ncbi:unnamed protein product [Rotaria socialis]|uniref:Uncharacterized protein n=1 Tax=Rotaria socialis TaxID=392032 RepID=A0A818J2I1_9BILA|nr:unnamed protein product [Rotaria socialis]CAF4207326.1 unnamed protein product [Rotaria socialis]
MFNRLTSLLIIACSIIHFTQSTFIFNITNPNKLLCYSCKGNDCEKITNSNDHMILCNRRTQLCWAGFLNQKPYRTCANRYCTPSSISLDSDVSNELCCRSNLCNSIPLSWSPDDESVKNSTSPTKSLIDGSAAAANQSTTSKTTLAAAIIAKTSPTPAVYVVNEIVNEESRILANGDATYEQDDGTSVHKFNPKESDPLSYNVNWERVPYNTDFSNRVVSMSKLAILIMPILLVLLF